MKPRRFLVNTALIVCHLLLLVPLLTSELPPGIGAVEPPDPPQKIRREPGQTVTAKQPEVKGRASANLTFKGEPINVVADEFEKSGDEYRLQGHAEIDFRDYVLQANEITYNTVTSDATASGDVHFQGGPYNVHMTASHGVYNHATGLGRFYFVVGTTGMKFGGKRVVLTTSSPFTFSGKEVDKVGPDQYIVHHGTVTSCELPHPKWTFNAARINFQIGQEAKIYNSTFRLHGAPVLYLPFAEHPVENVGRQTGFLIPTGGQSTSKGIIFGESFFWAINRSMDATIGAEYFSKRGFAQHGNFRALTGGASLLAVTYFGVMDRGFGPTRINQGGEDVHLQGEQHFANDVRAVANVEYLSSYLFRLAWSETFTTAVNSEVKSDVFATRNHDGYSLGFLAQRYQNFQSTNKGDYFSILHVPSFDASSVDRNLLGSPFYYGFDGSSTGLSRRSPTFSSANLVGRFDGRPRISLPVFLRGWTFRPSAALRDTFYTQHKTQETPFTVGTTINDILNRHAVEGEIEIRPPRLVKIYDKGIFGHSLKHTLEPRITYRVVSGINNFLSIVRFDSADILSNTNEVEYALTNRIYAKPRQSHCDNTPGDVPAECTQRTEWLSWEVAQKYFFDPYFGGALVPGVRNVLETTAEFSGVAFLTQARVFSPIVSRLRVTTSPRTDVQWLLDYDTKVGHISSSNVFIDYHIRDFFFGGSHALLHAPGEVFLTSPIPSPENFNQFRLLGGYGNPSRRGFSAAGNMGYDVNLKSLQYNAVQTSYNWDCCGLNFEYRRFVLGPVRNESQYRFAFSLANIGTFGNLKRQERLF